MTDKIEVLVLDDEPIVCERLQDYLEKKGIAVETFSQSQKALDRLKEKTFDVIVTDMKMEGPTGMDVLMAVKNGPQYAEVIMITGYGSSQDMRDAEAVGVFEYICKPFRMSDIYGLIKRAAKQVRKRTT